MLLDILTMILPFFFILMKMLVNTGCARKPLSPGGHLEIHLLMPLFAWLFQGNGEPCPTTPCPHSSPWSCPAREEKPHFLFSLKEANPNWENHEAGLKSLPGGREQTFKTNPSTPPVLVLPERWSPEWETGTVRGETERERQTQGKADGIFLIFPGDPAGP